MTASSLGIANSVRVVLPVENVGSWNGPRLCRGIGPGARGEPIHNQTDSQQTTHATRAREKTRQQLPGFLRLLFGST